MSLSMILGLVGDFGDIELRELRPHSPRGDGMVGGGEWAGYQCDISVTCLLDT